MLSSFLQAQAGAQVRNRAPHKPGKNAHSSAGQGWHRSMCLGISRSAPGACEQITPRSFSAPGWSRILAESLKGMFRPGCL